MVLDTNALSAFLAGDVALKEKLEGAGSLTIPAIVLGEYEFGLLFSSARVAIAEALAALLRDVEVLAVSSNTARHYAAVRSELKAAGTPIPENDVWIAAICRQHEQFLVSNDSHFDYVSGITRIAW